VRNGCGDKPDRSLDVCAPAGVNRKRTHSASRSQPIADDLVVEQERTRLLPLVAWPRSMCKQGAVRDTDGRHVEDCAEVKGQSGPARMVSTRGVYEQAFRRLRKSPHCLFEQRALAQRQ
jgi:hypothetical protein